MSFIYPDNSSSAVTQARPTLLQLHRTGTYTHLVIYAFRRRIHSFTRSTFQDPLSKWLNKGM